MKDKQEAKIIQNIKELLKPESLAELGEACLLLHEKYPDEFPTIEIIAEKLRVSPWLIAKWVTIAYDTRRVERKKVSEKNATETSQ